MSQKKNPLILIVEDTQDIQLLISSQLHSVGYDVLSATDGVEALKLLKTKKPDLILLDVMMPRMDGYSFCEKIQKDDTLNLIPVVFLTAFSGDRDKSKAFSVGAVDFLEKPVKKVKLLETIKKHIGKKKQWEGVIHSKGETKENSSLNFSKFKEDLAADMGLTETNSDALFKIKPKEIYSISKLFSISPLNLAKKIADEANLPFLSDIEVENIQLGVLPLSFCRAFNIVPIQFGSKKEMIVVDNPFQKDLIFMLKKFLKGNPLEKLGISSPKNIQLLLKQVEQDSGVKMHPDDGQATGVRKTNSNGRSILVVEDDENQVNLLQRFLEKSGFNVISAKDGAEGLMRLEEREYDLILLDLDLPHFNGFQFIQMKEEKSIKSPIVMITSCVEDEFESAAQQLGAKDFVKKPFKKDDLLSRINRVLALENTHV